MDTTEATYTYIATTVVDPNNRHIARQVARTDGHGALVGTDKQVDWAEDIRARVAVDLMEMAPRLRPEMVARFVAIAADILSETSARVWVERETVDARRLVAERMA